MNDWKDIKGFEGLYKINSMGTVVRLGNTPHCKRERIVANTVASTGYLAVNLYRNHKNKRRYIHRLLAEMWIPNPKSKPFVNHIDGNKLNHSIDNLEWTTASENNQHAYDTGLKQGAWLGKLGANHHRSRPIIKCDMHGNELEYFDNASCAQREHGFNSTNILNVARGFKYSKSAYGFTWKFTDKKTLEPITVQL